MKNQNTSSVEKKKDVRELKRDFEKIQILKSLQR